MQFSKERPATGHVFRVERKKGAVWFAKYRLPNGRQVKKKIGPAHTGRGRPPAGTYTERTANEWLRDVLRQAEAKTLPGAACPDVTFADAAREWLRYGTEERACKPSTVRSYRSSVEGRLIPAFGDWRLEEITARDLERWRATLTTSPRTKNKLLTELYGIFKRAQKVYGAQPRRRGREAARAAPRRTPGAHARGGARAVPRGSQRAGRRDLPDRGVYRPAPRRADRPCAGATSTSPRRASA